MVRACLAACVIDLRPVACGLWSLCLSACAVAGSLWPEAEIAGACKLHRRAGGGRRDQDRQGEAVEARRLPRRPAVTTSNTSTYFIVYTQKLFWPLGNASPNRMAKIRAAVTCRIIQTPSLRVGEVLGQKKNLRAVTCLRIGVEKIGGGRNASPMENLLL